MSARRSSYSRVNSDMSPLHIDGAAPLQHNLDIKKLRSRCCMCITAALIIAYILWLFDPPAGQEPPSQLKLVVVVHRHGARSSLNPYSFESNITWEVGEGELLDVGFHQGFLLGQKLRNKYWSQLSPMYDTSARAFSTNIDRTVDTATSVLFGLLLDNQTQVGNASCGCRPSKPGRSTPCCVSQCIGLNEYKELPKVEVWKSPDKEMILRQYDFCQKAEDWRNNFLKSSKYQNSPSMFQDEIKFAEKIVESRFVCSLGHKDDECRHEMETKDLYKMWSAAECLAYHDSSVDHNGPYDDVKNTSATLQRPAFWYWKQLFSPKIGPDLGGMLLNQILVDLEKGTKRQPVASFRVGQLKVPQDHSFIIYSAHDSTLGSLLAAMNFESLRIPDFTSHIAFELYGPVRASRTRSEELHSVRVHYDNEYLKIGECTGDDCSLDDFTAYLQSRRRINCTVVSNRKDSKCE